MVTGHPGPGIVGNIKDKEEGRGADLGGQGQAKGDAQRNLPTAATATTAAQGHTGGEVEGEQDKEGEEWVDGVKVGQLQMENGQAGEGGGQ